MIELHGTERILVNSAGDWGHSDPLAVPEFIYEMRSRGHDEATIRRVVLENPLAFFRQCHRFDFTPR
jgi:predicted metal-dependent TIM-barrel fold hydrolase